MQKRSKGSVFLLCSLLAACSAPRTHTPGNPLIEEQAARAIINARTEVRTTFAMMAYMRAMEADGTRARVCAILAGRGGSVAPDVSQALENTHNSGMSVPQMLRLGRCL